MAVLNTGLATPSRGFTIDQSLRFNAGDSAYLTRTSVTPTDTDIWTLSFWAKRTRTGVNDYYFYAGHSGTDKNNWLIFDSDDYINLNQRISNDNNYSYTDAKYRDPSSWYHVVYSWSSGTRKIYINGELETFSSNDEVATAHSFNVSGRSTEIGRNTNYGGSPSGYLDGYLAEVHFIDGTALTPSSFGETGDYGEWKPKRVVGLTYGDNGYYLDFADSAALGDDESGEGNDWTVNNLTAADQMLDTPTNNFCTWNPLFVEQWSSMSNVPVMKEGNLYAVQETHVAFMGTQAIKSHKVYFELHVHGADTMFGIMGAKPTFGVSYSYNDATSYGIYPWSTKKITAGVWATGPYDRQTDDIYMFAVDPVNNKMWCGKNGSWEGDPAAGTGNTFTLASNSDGYVPWFHPALSSGGMNGVLNCGQDSSFAGEATAQGNQDDNGIGDFYYDVPATYLALCTSNLPEPAVIPSEHFNTVLYTGNNTTNAITGVGFQPDFLWIKERSGNASNQLQNIIQGAGKFVETDTTAAEATAGAGQDVVSFDTDGFTLGSSNHDQVNVNTDTYVAWNWKMSNTTASNTLGNHSAGVTVSANQDAGQSVIYYVGDSASPKTVGHGLSKAPYMWFGRNLNDTGGWYMYHKDTSSPFTKVLYPNTSAAETSSVPCTATSSTLITFPDGTFTDSPNRMIVYCFHDVDGYSKFGGYTGNGDADGTFIYTGFRPAYVVTKEISNTSSWDIHDNKRDPYNVCDKYLLVEDYGLEGTTVILDFLSNGFKFRTTNGDRNQDDADYIYWAFAETPFKYSNAR